jgi:hypothetical protein
MDPAKRGVNLDEDDEFEEFDQDDWVNAKQDPKDADLWEKGWDDSNTQDYVGKQIRAQLQNVVAQQPAQQQQQQQQQ